MPAFEVLLPLGALAFYCYDCAVLLYGNEILFLEARGRWRFDGGSERLLLRRHLAVPAFLQPWTGVYRLWWREAAPGPTDDAAAAAPPPPATAGLLPVQLICTAQLIILVPILPAVSLGYGAGRALLAVFALYYLLIVLALVLLCWRRRVLQLSVRGCALLALDALACAPFAINLVRRVTLQRSLVTDALPFGQAALQGQERQRLVDLLAQRQRDALAGEAA
jgi:hypothetical protein